MPETEEKKTEERPKGDRPPREQRSPGGGGPPRGDRPGGDRGRGPGGGDRGDRGGDRSGDRGGRPQGGDRDRRSDGPPEIDIDKLIADSLYLDNQAHVIVSRMRRATRAIETERQHEFVMVRARLAYTIARHSLRSLDPLERLLLQVTRKNDSKGYERFRDLFEAIIAYNE
jgi:hypothetical protein